MTLLDDIERRMDFSKRQLATLDELASRLAGCDKISQVYHTIENDLALPSPEGLGYSSVTVLEKLRSQKLYELHLQGENNFRHKNAKETLVQLDPEVFEQVQQHSKVVKEGITYFSIKATRLLEYALLGVIQIEQKLPEPDIKMIQEYARSIGVELSPRYFRKEKERVRQDVESTLAKQRERMIRIMREGIHDLRSKMTGPIGYAKILRRKIEEGSTAPILPIAHALETTLTRQESEMNYLQRIFDEEEPQKEVTNLYHLVEDIVSERKDILLQTQQHYLENKLNASGLTLHADAVALAMVFRELINNASKYSAPGSEITIFGEREEEKIELYFQNNGVKDPQERLRTLFDKQYAQGTGIGMSFVQRVIEEEHKGKLIITSGEDYLKVALELPLGVE